MKIPSFRKNKLDRNITVNIINSQINGNTFDVRTAINQIPKKDELRPPPSYDFIDMGSDGNIPHIEAQRQLEEKKKGGLK